MKTNLQLLRKKAGFRSARAFAEELNIPVGTYTDYEQGRRNFALEQAWAFADVLGEALGRHVTIDELAGRDFTPASGEPSSNLSSDERYVVEAMRSTDARGRAAIMRNAESEAGVEGASSAGLGSDGMSSNVGRGA